MNILLITEFYPSLRNPIFTGGVETRAYFVSKYLAKTNNVKIISRLISGQKTKESEGNLSILRLGPPQDSSEASYSSLFSRFIFQLQAYLEGIKYHADVVEGSNYLTYIPAFLVGKKLNIPKFAWYPDVFTGKWFKLFGPFLGILGEITERLSLYLSWDGIIAISKTTREKIISYKKNSKVKVIYCGIDKNEFITSKKFENPTIIVVSRLLKYKSIDDAIRAVSIAGKTIKNLRLIIIGNGPQETNLKELVSKLSLNSAVEFKKNLSRTELLTILGKSHILCHPSTEEGFGIVILESLAAGTPYIASNISSISEITQKGKGGTLIKSGDIEGIAEKIIFLFKDQTNYNKLVTEGKELIINNYWQNIAKETENYFKLTKRCSSSNLSI